MLLKAKVQNDDFTTFVTFGTDFSVTSIADLVTKVGDRCKSKDLQELVLYAHGVNGSFSIGEDRLGGIASPKDAEVTRGKLAPLWPYFRGGIGQPRLILCICEAGKNPENLLAIADVIGVQVFGCEGEVRPTLGIGYGWWAGAIIKADPRSKTVGPVSAIPDPPIILS